MKSSAYSVLVLNPGSTSDEVAYFHGSKPPQHSIIRYSDLQLQPFDRQPVVAQLPFRKKAITRFLKHHHLTIPKLDAIIARGGLLKPVRSGTYRVNEQMVTDLKQGLQGEHPCNLAVLLAVELAANTSVPCFTADPVVVDELDPLARYSGMPENPRISLFHALNQKQVGRRAAIQLQKKYEELTLIIAHGGGGISVGLHHRGQVVDVNNALNGDGPFTPRRSGGVPAGGLVQHCFSNHVKQKEVMLKLKGRGGLIAYTGTADLPLLKRFINGAPLTPEERAILHPDLSPEIAQNAVAAMIYQMAKEICALTAYLGQPPDAVILTGGLTFEKELIVAPLKKRIEWLAPVLVFPGSDEITALHEAAIQVLNGTTPPLEYC